MTRLKKYRLKQDWLYNHHINTTGCTYGEGMELVQLKDSEDYYKIDGVFVPAAIVEGNSQWFELIQEEIKQPEERERIRVGTVYPNNLSSPIKDGHWVRYGFSVTKEIPFEKIESLIANMETALNDDAW